MLVGSKAGQAEITPVASCVELVIGTSPVGRFGSLSGLGMSTEQVTYEEGGQNDFVHRFPGRVRWDNLVLSRGLTQSDGFFDWLWFCSGHRFEDDGLGDSLQEVSITVLGHDSSPLRSYRIMGAYPIRWKGPEFNASNAALLVEEIEIAHQGLMGRNLTSSAPW